MSVSYTKPRHDAECIGNCGQPLEGTEVLAIIPPQRAGIWWAHKGACYHRYLQALRVIGKMREAHAA